MFNRLLSRLFARPRTKPQAGSPLFTSILDEQGNVVEMMDGLTQEYLRSGAPDPSRRDLDALLAKITAIRILDDGTVSGKALGSTVLLECRDALSIAALRPCLSIVEDPATFGHCMCLGDLALECYTGAELVATIGFHHGQSIRWDAWKHDALLEDGQAFLQWLAGRGVSGPLEAFAASQRRAEEDLQAERRWLAAMPQCLARYWETMQEFDAELVLLQRALKKAYPDELARALALFTWFGSGAGPWSGFPMYESVPEELLRQLPSETLIRALSRSALSPAQLEGAARYFAGWSFRKEKPGDSAALPQDLRERLLAHSLMSNDEDKLSRARKAFG